MYNRRYNRKKFVYFHENLHCCNRRHHDVTDTDRLKHCDTQYSDLLYALANAKKIQVKVVSNLPSGVNITGV